MDKELVILINYIVILEGHKTVSNNLILEYVDLMKKGKSAGRVLLSIEYQGPPMGGNQGQSNWGGNQGQSNWGGNQGPNQGFGNQQGPNQGWGNQQGPNQGFGNQGNNQGWGNQGGNNGW